MEDIIERIREKALKLKQLGCTVYVNHSMVIPTFQRTDNFDNSILELGDLLTNEEAEKKIDEKLEFFEKRPWIKAIRELNFVTKK